MHQRVYADPNHKGNKLRPKVRCLGCGELGCITYWGNWCFKCNVERMDRINGRFEALRVIANEGIRSSDDTTHHDTETVSEVSGATRCTSGGRQ